MKVARGSEHETRTLIVLLVFWALLVLAGVDFYFNRPESRIGALLVSWFGGVVSLALLQAIYPAFRRSPRE